MIYRVGINPTGLNWRRFVVITATDGRLLACAQIKPHRDGTRELASLAVQPEQRGKGLARALILHLQAHNSPPLHLTCRATLQPLYRKFGFRALAPEEMTPYFRRIWQIFACITWLGGQPVRLAVMRWDG